MARRTSPRSLLIAAVLAVLIITGLLIAVIVLATDRNSRKCQGSSQEQQQMPSWKSLYDLFGVDDGLDLRWFTNARNETDVEKAILDNVNMLETEVTDVSGNFYIAGGHLTLSNLLKRLEPTPIGLMLRLDTRIASVASTMRVTKEITDSSFNNPVIISLPVFSSLFDWTQFQCDSNVMVSFDLTTDPCQRKIGRGTTEYIDILYRHINSSAFIEIEAGSVSESWEELRWLLGKNEYLMLIVSATSVCNGSVYDKLVVRNDIDQNKVLYNFEETLHSDFKHLSATAGSSLLYFGIYPRDAGDIIWSHNTDTWDQIHAATNGEVMMIEGDIMLLGQNTLHQTDIPIMAHNLGDDNNITFAQWLDEIVKVDKGMKFDFKTLDAVKPALQITQLKRHQIKGPVWLNADLLKGPQAHDPWILASEFLEAVESFPEATLSIGWTTSSKGTDYYRNYTMAMVQEMHELCKNLKQPVTFPVRAEQLADSWSAFDWLLNQSRGYTLTVWTAPGDNVTKSEMEYIKRQGEAARIYFDLPKDLRPSFSLITI